MTELVLTEQASDASGSALSVAARRGNPPPPEAVCEINNLFQAYALFSDHGRTGELAELFTHDATWDGREIGYGTAAGPAEIAETVVSHFRVDRPMVHLPGPALAVAVSDTEADAFSWCLATRLTDGQTSPVIYFSYEDRLRRVGGSWLFQHRKLCLRFRGGNA